MPIDTKSLMQEYQQILQMPPGPEKKARQDEIIRKVGQEAGAPVIEGSAGPAIGGDMSAAELLSGQLNGEQTAQAAVPNASVTTPSMQPGVQGQPGVLNDLVNAMGLDPNIQGDRASLAAPTPGQKPPQPIQGGQEVDPPPGANTPMQPVPPQPGQKPHQGSIPQIAQLMQGQGQEPQQAPQAAQDQPQQTSAQGGLPQGMGWQDLLMGLAAGQAGLGRSPQVHQVLGNAAAGGFQAMQAHQQQAAQQRQQQFENQLAYMEAMSGGDQSQFERLLDQSNMTEEEKQQAIRRKLMGSGGTSISYDENGNPVVQIGGPSDQSMRPSTQGNIEEKLTDLDSLRSRLESIKSTFDPEKLQYQDKARFWLLRQKNKTGMDLTPEERDYLVETTQMKRRAYENLNLYIQEITGAQMSQEEAKRLRRVMPDPGDGIFDGDSPLQFEANLNDAVERTEASLRRYEDLRKRGLLPNDGRITKELAKENPLDQYRNPTDDLSAMSHNELLEEGQKLYEKAQSEGLTEEEYDRYQRLKRLEREKRDGGQ